MIAIRWSRFAHVISNSALEVRNFSCVTCNTDRFDRIRPSSQRFLRTFLLIKHPLTRDLFSFTRIYYLPCFVSDKIRAYQVFTGRLNVPDKRSKGLQHLVHRLRFRLKLLNSICDLISRSRLPQQNHERLRDFGFIST